VKVSWVRRAIAGESELREAGTKLAAAPGTTATTASLSDSSGHGANRAAVQRVKIVVGRDLTSRLFGQILGRIERLAWHPT